MGPILIGREPEVAAVDELLAAAATSLRCVVIEGEAGVGKTAVWEAGVSAARERGFDVCIARCRGSEAQLAFAALGDLLAEEHDVLEALPSPQRRVLATALLLEEHDEAAVEPRAVGLAFLNSLRTLAESSPLVLAIDDLQWIDAATAAALDFALARLEPERIAVLATARIAQSLQKLVVDDAVGPTRLMRVTLGPLSVGGIYELLRTRIGLELSRPVLTRLHAASGGNPLFALEIGRMLLASGIPRSARDDFPIPKDVERAVEARLLSLPPETQDALLTVALAAEPTLELLEGVTGDARRKLAPAADAKIVEFERERIRFAHPLFAAAVRATANPEQRRRLHARLASIVSNPEEQARHRARAATQPDAAVAAALEDAADDALRRGAPDAAADLLEEATRLASDDDERQRVTVAAAAAHTMALNTGAAASLLADVLPGLPRGPLRARALLEFLRTEPEPDSYAGNIVTEALENAGDDAHLRAEILMYAANLDQIYRGLAAAGATALAAVREAEQTNDGRLIAEALAYAGHVATLSDPGETGLSLLRRVDETQQRGYRLFGWRSPAHWIGVRLMWEDHIDEARAFLEAQLRLAEEEHDSYSQSGLCMHLTQLETRAGAPQRALDFAEKAWGINAASSRSQNRAVGLYAWALAQAVFGDEQIARAAAAEALETLESIGDLFFTIHTRSALAQLALSRDDPREAIAALGDVRALRARTQVGEPGIFPFDADEIEALVGVGQVEEADVLATELLDRGRKLGRARLIATGLRSRALIAAASGDLDTAEALLVDAIAEHERLPVPLERGRTLLALGTVLRRAQRKRDARETLEEAAALFAAIKTPRWEQRARGEAARIGGRTAPRGRLTAMEEKIADLAAAGHTNAEIAAELHVSPRTVQWNLSKVYKKLEVRSRTELAAARLPPHV